MSASRRAAAWLRPQVVVACAGLLILTGLISLNRGRGPSLPPVQVRPGFIHRVFAAQPLVSHPVAIQVDHRGRVYVAETNCFELQGYEDFDKQLACRTLDDARRLFERREQANVPTVRKPERLRVVVDEDADGVADRASVFCDAFDRFDGCAAGVAVREGHVWFANSPHLWRMSDANDDHVADHQQVLHTGFGVRPRLLGHDLHALVFGPDGKLYFSMGDRGLHVQTADVGTISAPDCGSVLRCNPDGSQLELYATGLRNPQGLAFDRYGNLWTCDNDSNKGDRSRWIYVAEGGDYGWRIGFQLMPRCGPYQDEGICRNDTDVPWRLPSAGYVGRAPSGIAYYPGTGLPTEYNDHFLVADYAGGIHSVRVAPDGAGFRVEQVKRFADIRCPTDVAFGPDGGVYVADWVWPYQMLGQGRIIRIDHSAAAQTESAIETQALLASGIASRSLRDLARLLGHADQRVRAEAQRQLAGRGESAIPCLLEAVNGPQPMRRIHAVWALSQIGRQKEIAVDHLHPLLGDTDPEVCAQVCRVLGDHPARGADPKLLANLDHASPRVRYFAAMSIGKVGGSNAMTPLLELLADVGNRDAYLRHAAVFALSRIATASQLGGLARHESAAIRLAAVLALRRQRNPELAVFLDDSDPTVVLAAVRAIHDESIDACLPAVAKLADRGRTLPVMVMSRVINANYRLGDEAAARTLADLAVDTAVAAEVRQQAVRALGAWASDDAKDRVVGAWRPLPVRDSQPAAGALRPCLAQLLRSDVTAECAALAAERLAVEQPRPLLAARAEDERVPVEVRAAALRELARQNDALLNRALNTCLESEQPMVQRQAVMLLATADPTQAAARLAGLVTDPQRAWMVRQASLDSLAALATPAARREVARFVAMSAWPRELGLERRLAARNHGLATMPVAVTDQPMVEPDLLLDGGHVRRGEAVFLRHEQAQCVRCHVLQQQSPRMGPQLVGIGQQRTRRELLESIIDPSAAIAQEYRQRTVYLDDGTMVTGIVTHTTAKTITLTDTDGQRHELDRDRVEDQSEATSAMPADFARSLTPRQLRDLVAYLANL